MVFLSLVQSERLLTWRQTAVSTKWGLPDISCFVLFLPPPTVSALQTPLPDSREEGDLLKADISQDNVELSGALSSACGWKPPRVCPVWNPIHREKPTTAHPVFCCWCFQCLELVGTGLTSRWLPGVADRPELAPTDLMDAFKGLQVSHYRGRSLFHGGPDFCGYFFHSVPKWKEQ